MNFKQLASQILSKPCPHAVRLIAIDGGGGAGKTTFAEKLAAELGGPPAGSRQDPTRTGLAGGQAVQVIPMDDFLSWIDLEGWWPRFEAQVLEPAFAGKPLRYQKRDWVKDMAGDGLDEWRELPPSPVLILEGIGSARRALGKRLHFCIWLEAPEGHRVARAVKRDEGIEDIQGIWDRWLPTERAFFEKERPWERADLVLDSSLPFTP